MGNFTRSFWAMTLAIIVILIGLFLVCAQRRSGGSGEDLASDDDQFRQELLQLLDLTEDNKPPASAETSKEMDVTTQGEDDVLALLVADKPAKTDQPLDTKSATTAETMGISADMFRKVETDVIRLEKAFERRTQAVDSLRRIMENRNARIQDLEKRLAQAGGATRAATKKPGNIPSTGFRAEYEVSRRQFESFKYQSAIESFQALLDKDPNNNLADNCQYWIGECYFGMKEYQKAIIEFQKVFAYSKTDKYDDAQLMIGLAYMRSGQTAIAQKEFETFLNNYANSEYAGIARKYYRNI